MWGCADPPETEKSKRVNGSVADPEPNPDPDPPDPHVFEPPGSGSFNH